MTAGPPRLESPNHYGCPTLLKHENLFGVVVHVKRDGLARCHHLRRDEEVLRVTLPRIELNEIRPSSRGASPAHEMLTVISLQIKD